MDTNIVVDLLGTHESADADWSRAQYAGVVRRQPLGCNHIVLAEVAAGAALPAELLQDLDSLHIELLPLSDEAALSAGRAFTEYRRRGGGRGRMLPDFLIAGHAAALGGTLMTRDHRVGSYFPDLSLITPETHP